MDKLVEEARSRAIYVLEKCGTSHGIFANGTRDGYNSVWARDSMIALLGASLVGKKFKRDFELTLATLSKYQTPNGQIPNCVDIFDRARKKQVTFATLDSSLWYLIGQQFYAKAYKSDELLKKYKKNIECALHWVRLQDAGEEFLPEQQPTSDWQDCFPHKYGHVLNSQALYHGALRLMGKDSDAEKVRKLVNGEIRADLKMFDSRRGYYLPWIWKSHNGIREEGHWFDALGNLLAIVSGLARGKENRIIHFVESKKINKPFPVRVIYPVIRRGSSEWKDYFSKSLAGIPHMYLNGGIWPYVGGFYVAALVKAKHFKKANAELQKLAHANSLGREMDWDFNEWINPLTGKPKGGRFQAWSAGMYLFAYECVKRKKVPFF